MRTSLNVIENVIFFKLQKKRKQKFFFLRIFLFGKSFKRNLRRTFLRFINYDDCCTVMVRLSVNMIKYVGFYVNHPAFLLFFIFFFFSFSRLINQGDFSVNFFFLFCFFFQRMFLSKWREN